MIPKHRFKRERVLALAPTTRGIGFIVFAGPELPVDWRMQFVKGDRNRQCLKKAAQLIGKYMPDTIVLEDYAGAGSRRSARVQRLIDGLEALAHERKVSASLYSRGVIRRCFAPSGARNKQQIAEAIGTLYPQLKRFVPPKRKIWLPEDDWMAIFDAASLALTHYRCSSRLRRAA